MTSTGGTRTTCGRRRRSATAFASFLVVGAMLLTVAPVAGAVRSEAARSVTGWSRHVLSGHAGTMRVVATNPSDGATGVAGTAPIRIAFSARLADRTALPVLSPPVSGRWHRSRSTLTFVPTGAYLPDAVETVTVPADAAGALGQHLAGDSILRFSVVGGSVLRVQQLLARLGYLPLQWIPTDRARLTPEAMAASAFIPPTGTFSWRFAAPPTLATLWKPGVQNILVTGALISFEEDHGPAGADGAPTGSLGAGLWSALLEAGLDAPAFANRSGYVYALASKASPETLTVWLNGAVAVRTLANTGIPQVPTVNGNFTVFLRYAAQIMKGIDPSGAHYADPVAWVAYFNAGEAVHYFPRASYGYPQSLGCVEVPLGPAKKAWPLLRIGTVITVAA